MIISTVFSLLEILISLQRYKAKGRRVISSNIINPFIEHFEQLQKHRLPNCSLFILLHSLIIISQEEVKQPLPIETSVNEGSSIEWKMNRNIIRERVNCWAVEKQEHFSREKREVYSKEVPIWIDWRVGQATENEDRIEIKYIEFWMKKSR